MALRADRGAGGLAEEPGMGRGQMPLTFNVVQMDLAVVIYDEV